MSLPRLVLAALAAGAATFTAAAASATAPRATVSFTQPESFRDVRLSGMSEESSIEYVRAELADFLSAQARRFLPEGQTLEVVFSDIDLAGEFEPWRASRFDDVRFVRSIYIPRLKYAYTVRDEAGAVVRQGEEQLSDLNFQTRIGFRHSDVLFYEKDMLRDWARRTLKSAS